MPTCTYGSSRNWKTSRIVTAPQNRKKTRRPRQRMWGGGIQRTNFSVKVLSSATRNCIHHSHPVHHSLTSHSPGTNCCIRKTLTYIVLLFWYAPLEVRSSKCRHQSPEWTLLNHVDCSIQAEIIGFQVFQFSKWEAVKILVSVLSGIWAMWPNREKRRAWTIAKRCGFSVVCLSSSLHTWWFLTAKLN